MSQEMMILLAVMRLSVDFNRPVSHFVQRQTKEGDSHQSQSVCNGRLRSKPHRTEPRGLSPDGTHHTRPIGW